MLVVFVFVVLVPVTELSETFDVVGPLSVTLARVVDTEGLVTVWPELTAAKVPAAGFDVKVLLQLVVVVTFAA